MSEDTDKLEKRIKDLEAQIAKYEENGPAKLYYSLKRKSWEMAELLNATSLKNIPLDDPKDKTFDRMKTIWNDSASIASAVKLLGIEANVTDNEELDVRNIKRRTTPESIADVLSNTNGKSD